VEERDLVQERIRGPSSRRAIVLPLDPNYRLSTVGMRQGIWNALFGPDP
jgi:hypothetical protein